MIVQVGVDPDGFARYGDRSTGRTPAEEAAHLHRLLALQQSGRPPVVPVLRDRDPDGWPVEIPIT
jgi:hypothetical protein